MQEYQEPQPVTGKLSVPLKLIPPNIQRDILEAVNNGQTPFLTFTVKNSYSDVGFSLLTGYCEEVLLEFGINADNITFDSE